MHNIVLHISIYSIEYYIMLLATCRPMVRRVSFSVLYFQKLLWIDMTDFSQLYIILKYYSLGFRLRINIWDYSSVCNDLCQTIFQIE